MYHWCFSFYEGFQRLKCYSQVTWWCHRFLTSTAKPLFYWQLLWPSQGRLNGQFSFSCGAAVHALLDDSFKWSSGIIVVTCQVYDRCRQVAAAPNMFIYLNRCLRRWIWVWMLCSLVLEVEIFRLFKNELGGWRTVVWMGKLWYRNGGFWIVMCHKCDPFYSVMVHHWGWLLPGYMLSSFFYVPG